MNPTTIRPVQRPTRLPVRTHLRAAATTTETCYEMGKRCYDFCLGFSARGTDYARCAQMCGKGVDACYREQNG